MIKTKQISLKHFVIFVVTTVYLTVCLLLTFEQNISLYQSYTEAIKSLKANSETIVLDKFELNSDDYLFALRDHKVAADTLVYGLHSDEKGIYLIAGIMNENDHRILLKLSVDSNVIQNYSKIRYQQALLTASINNVLKLPYQKEIYSIDDEVVWENIKYDVLLEGDLDEVLYISPIHS